MDDLDTRRLDINNNRYKEREDGMFFDRGSWRKKPETDDQKMRQCFYVMRQTEGYTDTNRHMDGCFQCPRCRLWHYVPDTFEFLCSPCSTIVANHPKATEAQKEGIKYWSEKSRVYWSVNRVSDPEIEARLAYRDALTRGEDDA